MRIAVVNNFFPPRVGGSSHLSESLAHQYAAAGHEVLVVTASFGDAPADEVSDRGYRVVRLPSLRLPKLGLSIDFDIPVVSGPRNVRRLRRLLDDFRPDVVHQHGQFLDLSWLSGRWARRRGVPVVLTVHTRLENPNRIYHLAFTVADYGLVRPLINSYDPYMVVLDRKMNAYIEARYRTREERLLDIPVGVELERFRAPGDGRRVRELWGLGDRPVILSLGHVIPLRHRLLLIDALPAIVSRFPDVVVLVVGNLHYDAFLDRAKELGVIDHVLCTGAVPKSEITDYFAAAQIEAHDLEDLGPGTACLEAMAAGVPVVSTAHPDNYPGIELRNAEHMLLVPEGRSSELADAICEVLADPEAAAAVAKHGRELVEQHFAIERVAAKHLEAFGRITG